MRRMTWAVVGIACVLISGQVKAGAGAGGGIGGAGTRGFATGPLPEELTKRISDMKAGPKGDGEPTEAWMKERAPGVARSLVEMLHGPRLSGREGAHGASPPTPAGAAMTELVKLDRFAVDALLAVADDADVQFRQNVVHVLGLIGRAQHPPLEPLGYAGEFGRWQQQLQYKSAQEAATMPKPIVMTTRPAGDPRVLAALMVASKNKEARVRSEAAWGLGTWTDHQSVRDRLVEMFGDDPAPQALATRTVVPRTSDGAMDNPAEAALRAFTPPAINPDLRDEARIWAFAEQLPLNELDGIARGIGQSLQSKNVEVRFAAARAINLWHRQLGTGHFSFAGTLLIDALRAEKDESTAVAICEALGTLKLRSPTPLLIEKLGNPGRISDAAAAALGEIGDPTATPALVKLAEKENRPAIDALGKIGDRACVPALIKLLETPAAENAAAALGELGDPRALQPLRKLAAPAGQGAHDDPETEALRALAIMKDGESIELFIDALGQSGGVLRNIAIEAMAHIKDQRLIPALANRVINGKGNAPVLQTLSGLIGQNFDHYNYPEDAKKFFAWWEEHKAIYLPK